MLIAQAHNNHLALDVKVVRDARVAKVVLDAKAAQVVTAADAAGAN